MIKLMATDLLAVLISIDLCGAKHGTFQFNWLTVESRFIPCTVLHSEMFQELHVIINEERLEPFRRRTDELH